MADLILHHYAISPFAEKIRAILGYKGLSWHGVEIPVVMPKPDLTALTGGYRKTPVMQIGCDVYCDTALIARVLDEIAPERPVFRPAQAAVAVPAGRWLDHHLFFSVITLLFEPAAAAANETVIGGPEAVLAFARDRQPMLATARVKPPPLPDARATLEEVLRLLEAQLAAKGPFLFGDEVGWADFCAYHPLWMLRANPVLAKRLEPYPQVCRWLDRIGDFGHGTPKPLAAAAALAVARRSEPRPRSGEGEALDGLAPGTTVAVSADDYALEPSVGRLVAVGPDRLAIAREDERAGRVVVHFPRFGYRVKPEV